MDVQMVKRDVRLQQWGALISSCQASGMTVKDWCTEKGINAKTYYYWLRKIREAACRQMDRQAGTVFAEVQGSHGTGAAITLRISGFEMEIHNGAAAEVIESTLHILKDIC
jgi:hypothetical protein